MYKSYIPVKVIFSQLFNVLYELRISPVLHYAAASVSAVTVVRRGAPVEPVMRSSCCSSWLIRYRKEVEEGPTMEYI